MHPFRFERFKEAFHRCVFIPGADTVHASFDLLYDPHPFGGLPVADFIARLQAEGVRCSAERYALQHLQPLYSDQVLFEEGLPWGPKLPRRRIYNHPGDLPVTETIVPRLIALPAFPNPGSEVLIDQYAAAIQKVVAASLMT